MSIVNENKDMSCRPCQGWHVFLQSPGKWTSVWCHDETVQMAWSR